MPSRRHNSKAGVRADDTSIRTDRHRRDVLPLPDVVVERIERVLRPWVQRTVQSRIRKIREAGRHGTIEVAGAVGLHRDD